MRVRASSSGISLDRIYAPRVHDAPLPNRYTSIDPETGDPWPANVHLQLGAQRINFTFRKAG